MDATRNPSGRFEACPQSKTSFAVIESAESSSRAANMLEENPLVNGDNFRLPFTEISQQGNLPAGNEIASAEMNTSDNVLPSMAVMDGSRVQNHENTGNLLSLWSAIRNRVLAVFQMPPNCSTDCRPSRNMRLHFKAALRRALSIDQLRRLHERLLSCRSDPSPTSSPHSIWLLGVCYPLCESDDIAVKVDICKQFEADLHSRIWITYRKGFQAIVDTKLTTDVGWGCMIRSGQMLLAQALVCHNLGRGWRRSLSEG